MFTYEDILAALQNGKSATDIGNEFADLLNKALVAQKEAEEKAKEKAKREEVLNAAADKVFDALIEYFKLADPSIVEDFASMNTAEKRYSLEESAKMLHLTDNIISKFAAPASQKKIAEGVEADTVDKIIENFLKKYID